MRNIMLCCLFIFIFIFSGCGEDVSSDSSNNFDVEGIWSGTWEGEGTSGNLQFSLEQQGEILLGIGQMNGSSCIDDFIFSGRMDTKIGSAEMLFLDPSLSDEEVSEIDPFSSDSELEDLGINIVRFNGTFSESGTITATYSVIDWGYCGGETGHFYLELQ